VKRLARYVLQGLGAVAIVGLSPWFVIYSETKPLTSYSEPRDTVTEYRSGFPIPFMLRSNLGQRTDIDMHALYADVALVAIAVFGVSAVAMRRYGRRRSGFGHNGESDGKRESATGDIGNDVNRQHGLHRSVAVIL